MMAINHTSTFAVAGKAVLFCVINTALLKLSLLMVSTIPGLSNSFLSSSIGPVLVLLTTYAFIKFDKKSFAAIGLKFEYATLKKFLIGFISGSVVMSIYLLCVLYALGLQIQPNKNAGFLFICLNILPIIMLLAFMEELIFRAYPLVTLKNKTGQLPALVITSLLFGLYHLFFGWGISGFISTSIWGLAFGMLALQSNGIAMPAGFHAAGNLIQLVSGTTGNSYSIWNIIDKNGQQVKNFSAGISTTMIAQVVLLACVVFYIKVALRKNTKA